MNYTIALSAADLTEADKKKKEAEMAKIAANIKEELEAIDGNYSGTENQASGLGLKKLEANSLSDEAIKKLAEDSLLPQYLKNTNKLESSADNSISTMENKKNSLLENLKEQTKLLDDFYEARKKEAEKQALKRGLARSSIIMGKIEGFDREKIDRQSGLSDKTAKSVIDLDAGIEKLQKELKSALDSYELEHAADISKKITELEKQREKEIQEVIKYNNTVQEKEVKYQESGKGASGDGDPVLKKEEKLAAVKKYLDTLPKADATEFIKNNDVLKEHLGTYYNYLLTEYNNKK